VKEIAAEVLACGVRRAALTALLALAMVVTALSVGTDAALGQEPLPIVSEPTLQEVRQAEATPQQTNPEAVEDLPLHEMDRGEAADLMQGVFSSWLKAPPGIFGDLQVQKFLSDTAAVISAAEAAELTGEGSAAIPGTSSMLLESTVPLRTENTSGEMETIDLGLEQTGSGFRPANPLTEMTIPSQLGDGIELPATGVRIDIEGAPENRSPSRIGDSVAFYPNVAEDTDLAVSPTPSGVETFTQLRTADASLRQTFNLELPPGAELVATEEGGAQARVDGQPLVDVSPPTATDANGRPVAVTLEVQGNSLVVTAAPDAFSAYPIVVDPTITDGYNWYYDGHPGWTSYRTPQNVYGNFFKAPDSGCSTYCFLRTAAAPGGYAQNSQAYWQYSVPRFYQDYEQTGYRPTSWIQAYNINQITFTGGGEYQASPGAIFAVSDSNGAWRSANIYPPNMSGSYGVNLSGDHTGKLASFGLFTTSPIGIFTERYLLTGEAQIVLGDDDAPYFGAISGPSEWVNTQPKPFNVTVSDSGLGVHWLEVKTSSGGKLGATAINNNCIGTAKSVCPRTWKGAQEGNLVYYNPTSLPQGTNNLKLEAFDGVSNKSAITFQVKVDHTAPTLALSGSMSEQATLGNTLPQYALNIDAKDGTTESPQSGVAKVEVKVDGVKVKEWSPGCTTQNCPLSQAWTLDSANYGVGKHLVEVIATDAVGIQAPVKSLEIEIQRDTTAPQLTATNLFYTAPGGWLDQKAYSYNATAKDPGGSGAVSIVLMVDGNVVKAVNSACAAGGCTRSLGPWSLNMANYEGGAHPAEVIATDGAGNATRHAWTINVDPSGNIGADEAAATLEAVDATSGSGVVSSTEEVIPLDQREAGNDPEVVQDGADLSSAGVPTVVEYSSDPTASVTLNTPSGDVLVTSVEPSTEGNTTAVVADASSVTTNSEAETDTVMRPVFDGIMSFEVIRGVDSPEAYSWQVELGPGQYLEQVTDLGIELKYEDGTSAMLISAQPAHDALGNSVPTTLQKTGSDEITLTVHHKGSGARYPVLGGPGFRVEYQAYVTVEPVLEGPPPAEGELPETYSSVTGGPPHAVAPNDPDVGARVSDVERWVQPWKLYRCYGICDVSVKATFKGFFFYDGAEAWYPTTRDPVCLFDIGWGYIARGNFCGWVGPNHQPYNRATYPPGPDYHISAQTRFEVGQDYGPLGEKTFPKAWTLRAWGNGYFNGFITDKVCNPQKPACLGTLF
jgi:hypothetical protein